MQRCSLIFLFAITFAWQPADAAEKQWQAGVATVNISPELPIWLSGYAARNKPGFSKHDDLFAKALVLEDANGHRATLVTMDLVGIDRELSATVCQRLEEQFKLPRAAIALSASHTHSGPVIRGNLTPMYNLDADQSRRVKEYKVKLADTLVQLVGKAIDARQPATLSYGIGNAEFAVNRRNNPEAQVSELRKASKLAGPVDHEVPVLVVKGDDGKERAIVAGYACHATVLNDYFISADWPGAAQAEIERRHPGAVALYFLGCGGDQNPLPRRSLELMKQHGDEFADAVDHVLASPLKPISPTLSTVYEEIDLPFGEMPSRAELEEAAASTVPLHAPWGKYLLSQWDKDGKLAASYPHYPVQAWKLGSDLTWIFLGGEVVVDYSIRLKTELGQGKTWVASYSNDVMGYIPSRRVLAEGRYEGGEARFPYGLPAAWSDKAEEQIVAKVHELADEVAHAK